MEEEAGQKTISAAGSAALCDLGMRNCVRGGSEDEETNVRSGRVGLARV